MTGEENLERLLASMSPSLADGAFVFCTFPEARYGNHSDLLPFAACSEPEGLTLVVPRLMAEQNGLSYASVYRCITLSCHSSLNAVGLTAAVSTKLAEHGIAANVIAGYFHDHLFVPSEQVESAMVALNELVRSHRI